VLAKMRDYFHSHITQATDRLREEQRTVTKTKPKNGNAARPASKNGRGATKPRR
jgi:hypothetical protein